MLLTHTTRSVSSPMQQMRGTIPPRDPPGGTSLPSTQQERLALPQPTGRENTLQQSLLRPSQRLYTMYEGSSFLPLRSLRVVRAAFRVSLRVVRHRHDPPQSCPLKSTQDIRIGLDAARATTATADLSG